MITVKQAMENPELMIKHRDKFKNIEIFKDPWYIVFWKHPYLYREFPDRFDEMDGWDVSRALMMDPTLISDLKDYLHKMCGREISHIVRNGPTLILDLKNHLYKMSRQDIDFWLDDSPELSLCIKHKDDPDKVEAAYYILFPDRLISTNKEEKREIAKRIMEILREEKM